MSDLRTPAPSAGTQATSGRRKAPRTPLSSRLGARVRTRSGRIGAGLATTAVLSVLGGAIVGATGVADVATAGADVPVGGTSASATADPDNTSSSTDSATANTAADDRAEQTEVSRSGERPEVSPLTAAKKAQVAKTARSAGKVRVKTSSMQDRDPRDIAKAMLSDFGFGRDQFSCLDDLWVGESNWRWNADNPTSSAYGIPQALPGSKMASAGADWETNPATQIKWGLGYIKDRFGTPCSALSFKQGNGWY